MLQVPLICSQSYQLVNFFMLHPHTKSEFLRIKVWLKLYLLYMIMKVMDRGLNFDINFSRMLHIFDTVA